MTAQPGDRVRAKRLGWRGDMNFSEVDDLDPYDYASDDVEGILHVVDADGPYVEPHVNYLVSGQVVDPATIEPLTADVRNEESMTATLCGRPTLDGTPCQRPVARGHVDCGLATGHRPTTPVATIPTGLLRPRRPVQPGEAQTRARLGWEDAVIESFHLPGKHNQSTHGRKSTARPGMGDITITEGHAADFQNGSAAPHVVQNSDGTFAFTPERQAMHDRIIEDALAGKTPVDNPTFNVMGGGPAAGKSHMVRNANITALQDKNAVMVNADDMKGKLPEYNAMVRAKDVKASVFAHEESSYLAARLQAAAFERKHDLILDGTGNSAPAKLKGKIDAARAAGYRIHGHYATVPTNVAVARAAERGKRTGRYVPESVIRGTHVGVSRTFPEAYKHFDDVTLYNTTGDVKPIMRYRDGKLTIHSRREWDDFIRKGHE